MPSAWFKMPDAVSQLGLAQRNLRDAYAHIQEGRLRFTLDGNIVGDIGELLAIKWFSIKLVTAGNRLYDGHALLRGQNRTVQVKASGTGRGAVYRFNTEAAYQLIFFELDFARNCVRILYNGPEQPVRNAIQNGLEYNHQREVRPNRLAELDDEVNEADRLPFIVRPPQCASPHDAP